MFEVERQLYQPIVEIKSNRVVGVEALSRFQGIAPHDAFRQTLESGGTTVVDLDLKCMEIALAVVQRIPAEWYMAVNLHSQTIGSHNLMDRIEKRDGTQWHKIIFEVVESDDVDFLILYNKINKIRAKGIRIAMDDVGQAYSGPYRITQMTPDVLKIDQMFVRGIDRFPTMRAIVRAFSGMASELRFKVVGEGVENKNELSWLTALGVEFAQGFFIDMPLTIDELIARIEDEHSTGPGSPASNRVWRNGGED